MADPLTRILSLALRHKPEHFGLTIDAHGWTLLSELVCGVNSQFPALPASQEDIWNLVANQVIDRFQIDHERIRARYGHSLRHVSPGQPAAPPALLFHATGAHLLNEIRTNGLMPHRRRYVHLTSDWNYAATIRENRTRGGHQGIILAVETKATFQKGVPFDQASNIVWLSPYVPPRFLFLALHDRPNGPVHLVSIEDKLTERQADLQARLASSFGEF